MRYSDLEQEAYDIHAVTSSTVDCSQASLMSDAGPEHHPLAIHPRYAQPYYSPTSRQNMGRLSVLGAQTTWDPKIGSEHTPPPTKISENVGNSCKRHAVRRLDDGIFGDQETKTYLPQVLAERARRCAEVHI